MKKQLILAVLLACITIFSACNSSRIFEENINLPDNIWNQNNVLTFKVDKPIDQKPYNLYYMVRHSADYPYQNLFVKIDIKDSKGNQILSKVHDIQIADEASGKPLGDGLGDIFDLEVLVLENFRFEGVGPYTIILTPQMRAENVAALGAIGIFIDKQAADSKTARAKVSAAPY